MNNKLKLALTGAVLAHSLAQPRAAKASPDCGDYTYLSSTCTDVQCSLSYDAVARFYWCWDINDYSTTFACACTTV